MFQAEQSLLVAHTQQSQTLQVDQEAAGRQAALMVAQVAQETLATSLVLQFLMAPAVAVVHGTHPVARVEQLAAVQVVHPELQEQQELQILDPAVVAVEMVVLMAALVDLV